MSDSKEMRYFSVRPEKKEICDYFRGKKDNLGYTEEDIYYYTKKRKMAVPVSIIDEFFNKNLLPREYRHFRSLCNLLEVEDDKLEEWKDTDAYFNYLYWDEIRKGSPRITYFGLVLKKNNEKYQRQDIVDGTGLSSTMITKSEFCRSKITFPVICKFADFYKKDVMDLFNEYLSDTLYYDTVLEIHRFLKESREAVGLSKEEIAEKLGISATKYNEFEEGVTRFKVTDIIGLSMYYGVSAQTLFELVKKANLQSFISTFDKATIKGEFPYGERRVTDISKILKKYKYLAVRNKKIEMHTFITLMYLFFYSYKSQKYYGEINYYLNNLFSEGNLIKEYLNDSDYNDKTDFEYFVHLRKKIKMSGRSVGISLNHSNSYIIGIEEGTGSFSPEAIKNISDEVGVSPAILTEGFFNTADAERDSARVEDLLATVYASLLWNYDGMTVKPNDFAQMIEILSDNKISGRQKYLRIKEINLVK